MLSVRIKDFIAPLIVLSTLITQVSLIKKDHYFQVVIFFIIEPDIYFNPNAFLTLPT